MELSASTIWWVLAGLAVAVELATGSFYLLMVALGLAAAALAAHAGLGSTTQIVIAALLGGGATALWHLNRSRQPAPTAAREDRDVNLDIGEQVIVRAWASDGTARVHYRGTSWTARLQPGAAPVSGPHVIRAVEGNWLVLVPVLVT